MNTLNVQARLAGLLYTLMIPTAIFAMIYVPAIWVVNDDIAATLSNLQNNIGLFKASISVSVIVQLLQLGVAFTLYWLFKRIDQALALSVLVLTAMSVTLVIGLELIHIAMTYLVDNSLLTEVEQQQWLATLLQLHEDGSVFAAIFWGLWLLPIALLILKSGWVPKFIGWALLAVFVAYVIDSMTALFNVPLGFKVTELVGWCEILLPIWLMVKGVREPEATSVVS